VGQLKRRSFRLRRMPESPGAVNAMNVLREEQEADQ
jgi:hypothetical protein